MNQISSHSPNNGPVKVVQQAAFPFVIPIFTAIAKVFMYCITVAANTATVATSLTRRAAIPIVPILLALASIPLLYRWYYYKKKSPLQPSITPSPILPTTTSKVIPFNAHSNFSEEVNTEHRLSLSETKASRTSERARDKNIPLQESKMNVSSGMLAQIPFSLSLASSTETDFSTVNLKQFTSKAPFISEESLNKDVLRNQSMPFTSPKKPSLLEPLKTNTKLVRIGVSSLFNKNK